MMKSKILVWMSVLGACGGLLCPMGLSSRGMKMDRTTQGMTGFSLAAGRDPAGVESVFHEAKKMRKSQLDRIARKAKPGSKVTLSFLQGGRRRRRRRFVAGGEDNHAGQEAVEKMKERVSLPPSWEFANEKELKGLAAMKVLLEKDFQKLAKKTVPLEDGQEVFVLNGFADVYGDIRLLRFLRKDRAQDPVSASMAYRKYLCWRSDNNVDEIRAQVETRPFEVPIQLQVVSELFPCDFDIEGKSTTGEHSYILASLYLGKWRPSAIAHLIQNDEISLRDFLLYWIYTFEALHKQLHAKSVEQHKMVFLDANCDLDGFSIKQLSPSFVSNILRPWIHQLQSNYPETAKRINVINPPRLVALLWKLLVPMLSPGTVAKIRIH